jgi:putative peptidoglycan lipid II flippase
MVGTAMSNMLALFRESIIAKYFGATYLTDSYVIAFTVASIFSLLFTGGAIQGAFIPVFSQAVSEEKDEPWKLASSFLNSAFLFFTFLTVVVIFLAPFLTSLFAPGFTKEAKALTSLLIRIIFPMVIFSGIAYVMASILQTYKHFTLPAFAPALSNLIVILLIILFSQRIGILSLAFGTLLGTLSQIFFQLPGAKRRGMTYSPFALYHPAILKIGSLMMPIVIYMGFGLSGELIQKLLASRLVEGSVATLNFAKMIESIPVGLFGMTLATVIFPTMADHSAKGNLEKVKGNVVFGLKCLTLTLLPITFGLASLSLPIVQILFERGAFTLQNSLVTSYTVMGYSVGLFGQGALLLLVRGYYALSDSMTPLKIGLSAFFLQILLCIVLVRYLGVPGLGLASSLYVTVYASLLYWLFLKRFGSFPVRLSGFFSKVLLSSIFLGLVCFQMLQVLNAHFDQRDLTSRMLHLMIAGGTGLTIFFICVFSLCKKDILLLWQTLKRK